MKSFKELDIEIKDEEWDLEYIDHDRLIARAIVYDEEGYFYFAQITRNDIFAHATLIETSGGGVESDEDLITAIKRELKEELGAEVEVICKLGRVSDYYNLIHRHNINNYFLCKAVGFGERNLMPDELNDFHMTTLRLTYEEALSMYERCKECKLGRLIANREIPVLKKAGEVLNISQRLI